MRKRSPRRAVRKAHFDFVWLPPTQSPSASTTIGAAASVSVQAPPVSMTVPVRGIALVQISSALYARPVGPRSLLTRQEAAAALGGANRVTVYRLLRDRQLRTVRQNPDGDPLIPLTDIQRYLRDKASEPRGRPLGGAPARRFRRRQLGEETGSSKRQGLSTAPDRAGMSTPPKPSAQPQGPPAPFWSGPRWIWAVPGSPRRSPGVYWMPISGGVTPLLVLPARALPAPRLARVRLRTPRRTERTVRHRRRRRRLSRSVSRAHAPGRGDGEADQPWRFPRILVSPAAALTHVPLTRVRLPGACTCP